MAGKRHLPLIQRRAPEADTPQFLRARIAPCTGCMNQTPVTANPNSESNATTKAWPCPKVMLYAQKAQAMATDAKNFDYDHPVYDDSLKAMNPVPAGVGNHENPYSYVFVSTYEDNVDSGWNHKFDTRFIRCRGPYLIATPERLLNILSRPDQGDHVLVFSRYYFLDGAQFEGFVTEAATWQVHTNTKREIDRNIVATTSGAK